MVLGFFKSQYTKEYDAGDDIGEVITFRQMSVRQIYQLLPRIFAILGISAAGKFGFPVEDYRISVSHHHALARVCPSCSNFN